MSDRESSERPVNYAQAFAVREPWNKPEAYWKDFLVGDDIQFSGNVDHAAIILSEISHGIRIVTEAFQSRGLSYSGPGLAISVGKDDYGGIAIDSTNGVVVINKIFLTQLAEFQPDEPYELHREGGFMFFQGTVRHFARLSGVEETYHNVYAKYKGKAKFVKPLSMSGRAYDAQDHEFRALLMQLRVAKAQGFPKISIDALKERESDARMVRRLQSIQWEL